MNLLAWFIFIAAAVLEVGGDAVMRKGLRGGGLLFVIIGAMMLSAYGLTVNLVKWDFSRLLGVYVAIFAIVSICFGRFIFKETVPTATWIGLVVIVIGGLIIQFGAPAHTPPKSAEHASTQALVDKNKKPQP